MPRRPGPDPGRRRFAPYLRTLADALGLRDWKVAVGGDPPDGDSLADVRMPYGRKVATVRVSDGFLGLGPAEQRRTLAHELIHCHLEPAWEIAAGAMPGPARDAFRRMAEYAVDGLADAVGPLLPMPGPRAE